MYTCQYRNYRFSSSQQDVTGLPSILFLHSLLEGVFLFVAAHFKNVKI